MGGNAFTEILGAAAFPRLPPAVYWALKANILVKISDFYGYVSVPREAPEKVDHGDLDFLVTDPKPPYTSFIPHDVIKKAIDAKLVNEMEGNRTSNYAVPVKRGQWIDWGHDTAEQEKRAATDDGEIYYQIDVCVCSDRDEFNRVNFFHSYGDLGMILGLIASNNGLSLGAKGLKLPDPPNPPLELSASFDEITSFLGLPMKPFEAGFQTREEVYRWAASSKYFDFRQFRSTGPGISKVKAERSMYFDFVDWVTATQVTSPQSGSSLPYVQRQARARQEALIYFNKKQEYETLLKLRSDRLKLKEFFSGSRVRDWADMGEHWKGVKLIMDEVRQQLGGDNGVLKYLEMNGEENLRLFVVKARDELGIQRVSDYSPPANGSSDKIVS